MKRIRLWDMGDGRLPKVLAADRPAPEAGAVYVVEGARSRREAAQALAAYKARTPEQIEALRALPVGELGDDARLALTVSPEGQE